MSGIIEWRPVAGEWEGQPYEVSELGWIRHQKTRETIWAGYSTKRYIRVLFPGCKHAYAHRVVAQAFIGPCPLGMQVNHINGCKTDNRAVNLEYVTAEANVEHSADTGLHPNGISRNVILAIRDLHAEGWKPRDLAETFGVSVRHVYRLVQHKQRRLAKESS